MSRLIIIGGSLATGKSTIAKYVEGALNIKRISMDEIKESLFDLNNCSDREHSKQIGREAWIRFKQEIENEIKNNQDIVADATFLWADDIDWINHLVDVYGVDIFQIWMTADPVVARQRFIYRANNERHPGHCDSLEHVIDEFSDRFFNKSFIPHPFIGETLVIDTTDFDKLDYKLINVFLI
jgi:predicted kinase